MNIYTKCLTSDKTYIIAEAGVNHNGDPALAIKLIEAAKKAGADAIKFQTFQAEEVVIPTAEKAEYQKKVTAPDETQYAMLKKLELPMDCYDSLKQRSDVIGIDFISTPYNFSDVDFLDTLGVDAFKCAAMHLTEIPYLQYVASKKKPMILSTGMGTLSEIDEAVHAIWESGNKELILLQCTTDYPSRIEDANLRVIPLLKKIYNIPVGYSDHTSGILASCIAVGLGAMVIEKHFTLDKKIEGPDHLTSLNPDEFMKMVENVRMTELLLGSSLKYPSATEKKNASGMRRSIVLSHNCPKGHILNKEDTIFKRPANGLAPKFYYFLIGKKLRHGLPKNHQLQLSDLE